MTEPLVFTARSAHADLPFLFAAQAQKEATVNEALARIDALLAPSVAGEAASPPASPVDGECWIVAADPQGSWTGHAGELAFHAGGTWLFAEPRPGMALFDTSAQCVRRWIDGWRTVALPAEPSGGTTIDSEARAAIATLIDGLRNAGMAI